MKRIILGIVCILLNGYAYAMVAHPEDSNIVGGVIHRASFDVVCFNNDGVVVVDSECDQSSVDEGYIFLSSGWNGGFSSGINGCGTSAVNPVSSATCPLSKFPDIFAFCTANEFVLVQTTKSGHFWTVKANGSCDRIATPETTGLVPCLSTDAFDPANGCVSVNPPEITVQDGYIKLQIGNIPPPSHCDDSSHEGRMIVDSVNDLLYICTQSGWNPISVDPP